MSHPLHKALNPVRERKTSRSCFTRFRDSTESPRVVRHSSSPSGFKVRPHRHEFLIHMVASCMMTTWAEIYPYISARNKFHCQATLWKNHAILILGGSARLLGSKGHTGSKGPQAWTQGTAVAQAPGDELRQSDSVLQESAGRG